MAEQSRKPITVGYGWSRALGPHITLHVHGSDPDEVFRVPLDEVDPVTETMRQVAAEEIAFIEGGEQL